MYTIVSSHSTVRFPTSLQFFTNVCLLVGASLFNPSSCSLTRTKTLSVDTLLSQLIEARTVLEDGRCLRNHWARPLQSISLDSSKNKHIVSLDQSYSDLLPSSREFARSKVCSCALNT